MDQALEVDLGCLVIDYRRRAPGSTALEALDAVMNGRQFRLVDCEPHTVAPCTPFGDLLAEAFDRGMEPSDWRLLTHPSTPPAVKAALRGVWESEVLANFAERYRLR